jgi:2-amino-4,5-dihydroxy-6-oxo-7-(phosphonooxy)heptanoate synthase
MKENTGRLLRLKRLYKHESERLFIVPMDHSVTDGPFAHNDHYERTLETLASSGVDAVVLHKGRLRSLSLNVYRKMSVIVHVSASTKYAPDINDKHIVASVEDAARRGADGISVHVNMGSATEARQLRDLSRVADSCDEVGLPLLAMIYVRGGEAPAQPSVAVAHAASLAADLGADIVKVSFSGDPDEIVRVTSSCPIPVVAAGGPLLDREIFLRFVKTAVLGGAAGLAAGRNVFLSGDVGRVAREIRRCLDGRIGGAGRDALRELASTDVVEALA